MPQYGWTQIPYSVNWLDSNAGAAFRALLAPKPHRMAFFIPKKLNRHFGFDELMPSQGDVTQTTLNPDPKLISPATRLAAARSVGVTIPDLPKFTIEKMFRTQTGSIASNHSRH